MKTPDQKLPEGSPQEEATETPAQERREQSLGIDKGVTMNMAAAEAKGIDMGDCPMPESLKR